MNFLTVIVALALPVAVMATCNQGINCKLPNCFCSTLEHPMKRSNIPQMVFFGFDDAVTGTGANFYNKLFPTSRKNPNGCPIGMSLYISNNDTEYSWVKHFKKRGFELAVHSVTHTHINTRDKILREARDQKSNIARYANTSHSEIVGWRSPYLETVGDDQVEVLKKLGYEYDISLTHIRSRMTDRNPWPFTMDFGWPYNCQIRPCPQYGHKGFWTVPVNAMRDYKDQFPCAYVDGCYNRPSNSEESFRYLMENFNSAYKGNRAPMGLNMHYAWFMVDFNLVAMDRFIREILKHDDVYIITVKQVIEWMKNPTKLSEIKQFAPWSCGQALPTKAPTTTTPKPTTTTTTTPKPTTTTTTRTTTTTTRPTTTKQMRRPTRIAPQHILPINSIFRPPMRLQKNPATSTVSVIHEEREPKHNMLPQAAPNVPCVQGYNCHLPSCYCAGTGIPGDIAVKDTPQMVYFTFDGTLNYEVFGYLRNIFSGAKLNPNKCPISGTFFVSQQGSFRYYLKAFNSLGMDISMKGYSGTNYNDQNALNDDMVSQIKDLDSMEITEHQGWRSPNLKPLGDGQFDKVMKNGFKYDASLTLPVNHAAKHWPFTLDYGWQGDCVVPDCPKKAYPGLWEVPNTPIMDYRNLYVCNFVDGCMNAPPTANDTFNFLWNNFMAHYSTNKAPFGLHFRHIWFSHPHYLKNLEGFRMFLDRLRMMNDVYVVSIRDVINWMKHPTPLDKISKDNPWKC